MRMRKSAVRCIILVIYPSLNISQEWSLDVIEFHDLFYSLSVVCSFFSLDEGFLTSYCTAYSSFGTSKKAYLFFSFRMSHRTWNSPLFSDFHCTSGFRTPSFVPIYAGSNHDRFLCRLCYFPFFYTELSSPGAELPLKIAPLLIVWILPMMLICVFCHKSCFVLQTNVLLCKSCYICTKTDWHCPLITKLVC